MTPWSERQLAMLREMGVQHFWPQTPQAAPAEPTIPAAAAPADRPLAPSSPPPARPSSPGMTPAMVPAVAPARPIARPAGRPAPTAAEQEALAALRERPAGIEHMDWPNLRQTVASCQACGLCQGRRQTVFGVGNIEARWMLVGEAPGEQEDRLGEPFVGRSGQLLDRMLMATGLTRQEASRDRQVYIANVIKCRPPGNRNPLPEEVAQCEPYLLRQMALVQPKLILAMGRFAVQSLLKSTEPIGRLRGQVHDYHGVPLIVTYHPAYLLRNPADKALAWDDLCRARELIRSLPA